MKKPSWEEKLNKEVRIAYGEILSEQQIQVTILYWTDFIRRTIKDEIEAILPEKKEKAIGGYDLGLSNGFNSCLSQVKEIIKTLKA